MQFGRLLPVVLPVLALASAALAADSAKVVRGQLPPDFSGATLRGGKLTLSEFRGKSPVVLSFYAQAFQPCRKEFAHLKELDEKYGAKGLKIVAVAMDEARKDAVALPDETRVRFPVVFSPGGGIGEKYGVQALPPTVVLNRDGTVHAVLIGTDGSRLDRAVEEVVR